MPIKLDNDIHYIESDNDIQNQTNDIHYMESDNDVQNQTDRYRDMHYTESNNAILHTELDNNIRYIESDNDVQNQTMTLTESDGQIWNWTMTIQNCTATYIIWNQITAELGWFCLLCTLHRVGRFISFSSLNCYRLKEIDEKFCCKLLNSQRKFIQALVPCI